LDHVGFGDSDRTRVWPGPTWCAGFVLVTLLFEGHYFGKRAAGARTIERSAMGCAQSIARPAATADRDRVIP
jgi:hypothetical protein